MGVEEIKNRLSQFEIVLNKFPQFRYLGDPILRTPTQEVSCEQGLKVGKELGEVLVEYRKLTGMGRGLAAPQIGINKSVFVTYLKDELLRVYINPNIVNSSKETNLYRELCLSSGVMWADVERSKTIEMEWIDESGKTRKEVFDDFLARLLQHEYDHLKGVCNLDRAVPGTIEVQLSDPLQEKLRDK